MGVVDTGSGYRVECDNCQWELEPRDPVVVWHKQRRADIGSGYLQVRGCMQCADAAINEEYAARGFGLRRAVRVISGETLHVRHTQCAHCGREIIVATETKYKGDYTRVVYCSDDCRDTHKMRQPITCKVCRKSFIPSRSDAKTCSPACKQKAYRLRRRV